VSQVGARNTPRLWIVTRGAQQVEPSEPVTLAQTGLRGEVVNNPHNQTLNVAVQWGFLGIILLYAMWLSHLRLFVGSGLAAWIGLVVVTQNVVSSLLNSHLFDFHEGWIYVLGVGVAGGMRLRQLRTLESG